MKASKAAGAHARPDAGPAPPEASPRSQLSAPDAQLADRDTYLKLAENLEGFLARPRTSAQAASTKERLRVLRLRAKDVPSARKRSPSGTASPIRDTSSAQRPLHRRARHGA